MLRRLWFALASTALYAPVALAASNSVGNNLCDGANVGSGKACAGGASGADNALTKKVGDITDLLLYLAGALAVLVIIIGGIRYVTSTGDAGRIKAAKDTILYGVIGLVVALIAYAIVKFIVAQLT